MNYNINDIVLDTNVDTYGIGIIKSIHNGDIIFVDFPHRKLDCVFDGGYRYDKPKGRGKKMKVIGHVQA